MRRLIAEDVLEGVLRLEPELAAFFDAAAVIDISEVADYSYTLGSVSGDRAIGSKVRPPFARMWCEFPFADGTRAVCTVLRGQGAARLDLFFEHGGRLSGLPSEYFGRLSYTSDTGCATNLEAMSP